MGNSKYWASLPLIHHSFNVVDLSEKNHRSMGIFRYRNRSGVLSKTSYVSHRSVLKRIFSAL